MRKQIFIVGLIISFSILSCESPNSIESIDTNNDFSGLSGTFVDERNNEEYSWVRIGDQIWMAENINYNMGPGSWLYEDNITNLTNYGRLYSYETACDVCPYGWHLPNYDEWMILANNLGGRSIAGGKMKEMSTNFWNSPNLGATNSSGFTALPGGYRDGSGNFSGMGQLAYFWSSYIGISFIVLMYDSENMGSNDRGISGLSVRCVRYE